MPHPYGFLKRGAEYLSRAIELDPNFALAHAELARVISIPCYYGAVDPNVAYPRPRDSVLRALQLDPNVPKHTRSRLQR